MDARCVPCIVGASSSLRIGRSIVNFRRTRFRSARRRLAGNSDVNVDGKIDLGNRSHSGGLPGEGLPREQETGRV